MNAVLTTTLSKAISLAVHAHEGQVDKAGSPYILHPLRVMLKMPYEDLMIVAVLHDVIEDTRSKELSERITSEDFRVIGLDEVLIDAIEALTKEDGESYEDFLTRAKSNWRSLAVKIADIEDNMNLSRISSPTQQDMDRMEKYAKALQMLREQEKENEKEMESAKESGMFRALIQYEGKTWYIDLTDMDHTEIKIMNPDGSWREAFSTDGNFMEVLNMGMIISREKITF